MARTNSDEKEPESRRKKSRSLTSDEKRRYKKARVEKESSKEMNEFSRIQSDISMTLAKHVLSMNKVKDKNVVLSPVSMHVILGFMASGFGGDSESRKEILSYLNCESSEEFNSLISQLMEYLFADESKDDGPRLSFANGMWIDQRLELKDSFKELVVDKAYKACVKSVDFQNKADEARSKQTRGPRRKQTV